MDDYIRREDVLATVLNLTTLRKHVSVDSILFNIGKIRPADVRPVVYGKWIESTELSEQVKGKKFCSNCGKAQYAIELTDKTIQIKSGTSKFCPECGARMDGGKEDE